jgi:hypothetical protein
LNAEATYDRADQRRYQVFGFNADPDHDPDSDLVLVMMTKNIKKIVQLKFYMYGIFF